MKKSIDSFSKVMATCLVGCVAVQAMAEAVPLFQGEKPLADIVVAKNADKAARFAAKELQYHLNKITGGKFRIITDAEKTSRLEIRVGESNRTKLKKKDFHPQEYLVNITPSFIELMGQDKTDHGRFFYMERNGKLYTSGFPSLYDEQGTMYAVYDFLENQCGVKWIDSTDYGTIIPQNKKLSVQVGKKRAEPFMSYRGGTFDFKYNPQLWGRKSEGEKRYNQAAYSDLRNMDNQKKLFLTRMRAGGDFSPANHSFYNYYERFLDKNHKNFETYKPQYFAKGYIGREIPQLCYGNPETVAQVVKDIRDYFDKGGYHKRYRNINSPGFIWGKNHFCLEPMDNSAFCKCKLCTADYEPARNRDKGMYSTYWFKFVNKVAKEIKKSHPDKTLTTLAYASHEGLPAGIKLEDNVIVYFCISANRMPYTVLLEEQLKRMKEWRDAYPNQPMAMWLYNTFPWEIARNGNFHCFPGFFAHETERQFKLFKKWNIRFGVFHCGFTDDVDCYQHLKYMFDPSLSADDILDRYFSAYGKAGKPLREFYELVERRYCDKRLYPANTSRHQSVQQAWGVLGNKKTMDRLGELMAEAEKLAETPEEKARVNLWRLGIYDYMKQGYDSYCIRSSTPTPAWSAVRIADCGGDPDKVPWNQIKSSKKPFYFRGIDQICSLKTDVKMAHDGKYFYLELTEFVNPRKLIISPQIVPFDTWELIFAVQKAQPFRYYISSPDARMFALSYGEVNWRQGVSSEESGRKNYGAVCKTNRTEADRWMSRYSFPMDNMLNITIKPGDSFYANFFRVASATLYQDKNDGTRIYTSTSYTTTKTIDRAGKVTLER
ncbi:MAG: DUF4838 domain-containing protein [Victivallales bacterium]